MAVVCLITPGQPSTNPRLVKEADAVVQAGHRVHLICAHWADWANTTDRALLQSRQFECTYVGGWPGTRSVPYLWSRVRHTVGKELLRFPRASAIRNWALCRVTPELERAARRVDADLYIAHNLGALPAAAAAARQHAAALGFDAEDFHSGMSPNSPARSRKDAIIEELEREFLPQCDYVTAASPLIARAYARKYSMQPPQTILNAFPLKERPPAFRPSTAREPLRVCWFSQTIGHGRGLEDVIRALGMLAGQNTELHLLGQWSAGYKQTLDTIATSVGLSPAKIHSHAPIRPDEVILWAAMYDVGVAAEQPGSTNREICLTNKLFAYLLAGNAVMATATQAQREFMDCNPGAGFCYRPGDAIELAAKLRVWCDDRRALTAARRRAWDYGTARFNWDLEKSKFLTVIQTVLERRRRRIA
jgi:glycosyltransferase involved in cell wall biosynthesis